MVCNVRVANELAATGNMAVQVVTANGTAGFSYAPGDYGVFTLAAGQLVSVDGDTSPGAILKVTNVGNVNNADVVEDGGTPVVLTPGSVFQQAFVLGQPPHVVNVKPAS